MFSEYTQHDGLGLAELVRRKEISPGELLETAIAVCEQKNPKLNAVVTPLFDQARDAASKEVPNGPFAGVPYLFKELVVSVLGAPTTFASRLYADNMPVAESELVRRCRQAGFLVMGKTNSSEFGLSPVTEPSLFGPTRNPWNPAYSPGGSSGGSAAAVAAGILPMAHATDGGGSIRIPASCCGLFGLKPTRARITAGPESGEGMAGFASQHAVSWSVRDSAALLDVTAGPMPGDPYYPPPPATPYLEQAGRDPKPLRIAYSVRAPNGAGIADECINATKQMARLCESLGHMVEESQPEFDIELVQNGFLSVFQANTMTNIGRATGGAMPAPGEVEPLTRALAERGRAIPASEYIKILQGLQRESRRIAAFFADHDMWLTPTLATPPPLLGQFGTDDEDVEGWFSRLTAFIPFTFICNVTGQPAMSVPAGKTPSEGLPVGCHFAAPYGEEGLLFSLAGQLERARPWAQNRPD